MGHACTCTHGSALSNRQAKREQANKVELQNKCMQKKFAHEEKDQEQTERVSGVATAAGLKSSRHQRCRAPPHRVQKRGEGSTRAETYLVLFLQFRAKRAVFCLERFESARRILHSSRHRGRACLRRCSRAPHRNHDRTEHFWCRRRFNGSRTIGRSRLLQGRALWRARQVSDRMRRPS